MKLSEVVDNLRALSASLRRDTFIYDFLLALGTPKATIARLKSGDINLAKKAGCTLLKSKVYFESVRGNPEKALEASRTDRTIAKGKARFFIATDFKILAAYDARVKEGIEIPIAELHEHYAFFLPLAGMEKTVIHAETEADVKAAEHMAKLYDLIRSDNPASSPEDRHSLNVFLTRLLFCYFAEDTGIFPERAFTNAIATYTQTDASDLAEFLQQLFLVLNTDSADRGDIPKHLADFPYVNGGLYSDTPTKCSRVPQFSQKARQKLIELGAKNWKEINPDIFGSMFQGVVDDEMRAELGMHYTSVPNIMKVIRPLFLDELYEEFEKAKRSETRLGKLLDRIYHLRIFDPACGSGNFLIIAYKELRRLEMAIFRELQKLTTRLPLSRIQVRQFYGVELDDFAHEVAILALWLAEHQMNVEFAAAFGRAPASLPLKDGAKISCGNALREDWLSHCPKEHGYENYVLGNPPYYGARKQSQSQKADLALVAESIDGHNNLDYIAGFFLKAGDYVRATGATVAFVTTNSVCQGEQVALLWPHVLGEDVEINFAYKPFKWSNSAKANAGVTCVIVGIRPISARPKRLFGLDIVRVVPEINPYLVPGRTVYIHKRRTALSQLPSCDFGSMPNDGGHLLLEAPQLDSLRGVPSAMRFIRNFMGTDEFIDGRRRWCLWIKSDEVPLALDIPEIKERVDAVRNHRLDSSREATKKLAERPHQFAEIRHKDTDAIIVPAVSSERREYIPSGLVGKDTVVSNLAFSIPGGEAWVFAVISSKMHMAWARAVAGGLETRIRYSSSLCYNNFPFPRIGAAQKKDLGRLAEDVLSVREKFPQKTIAQLYDPETMPADLLSAHKQLDVAVERCYRSKPFTSDEERLELLFTLYEKMIQGANE